MSGIHILGAGMAGLLAANMLRRFGPFIYEAQPSLPDNHGALLRFRTDAVARATRLPFQKVRVLKAVKDGEQLVHQATIRHSNEYSLKVTGEVMTRSILDLDPVERYIAPDDFLGAMAKEARIKCGHPVTDIAEFQKWGLGAPIISTIPMPVMMKLAGWKDVPDFRWRPIWSVTARIRAPLVRLYQTIYYPSSHVPYYRASITGSRLIIEYAEESDGRRLEQDVVRVLRDFGIDSCAWESPLVAKRQEYGKLLPIPDDVRRAFILAMTDQFGVYSVGRFATWRQILLDDVVHDVEVVERFITTRDSYTRHLHHAAART